MTQKNGPAKNTIAQQKYDTDHCVRVTMKLNIDTDAAMLTKLSQVPSMSGYIRGLVMEDIKRNSPELLKVERFHKVAKKQSVGRVQKKIAET